MVIWGRPPNVNKRRWSYFKRAMVGKFTKKQRDYVEGLFSGDIDEPRYQEKGLDKGELDKNLEWMRKHPKQHRMSKKQIDFIEKDLEKRIKHY